MRLGSRVVSVLDSGAEGPGFKCRQCHVRGGSAFAAERRAAAAQLMLMLGAGQQSTDQYLLPGAQQQTRSTTWDRRTDGRVLQQCW